MKMEPRQFKKQFITDSTNIPLKPMGIVLHDTATPGATAQNEWRFFEEHTATSVHAFCDWIEDIQIVPWNIKCYHCGEPANSMFIGVEMCVPEIHDPEKFNIVYWATVDAFARLYRYVLNIKTVTKDNLMTHDEVRAKWKDTSHTDPTSYLKEYGKNIDMFRKDVQFSLDKKWLTS
jgi:N-acetylmuramoyl-L-alanine amidase